MNHLTLTFKNLRNHNITRCDQYFPGDHLKLWTPADWMTALVGEVGELANVLKKLKRGYDLTKGMNQEDLRAQVNPELGDIQCYLDLLAVSLGTNLAQATCDKFNEVSRRVGYPFILENNEP